MSQMSFSDFEYAGKRKQTRREHFLSEMNQVVPWSGLLGLIEPFYRHRINSDRYSYRASLQEIRDNNYNLNIPSYLDTFETEAEIDLLTVRAERQLLKEQLAKLEVQMDGYLKELGYGA
ncbi:N-6 DNA methylase [Pseudomonas sp. BLCC-B112]|uniref:N-6 DNA methylase n=1 Tax=Pseudomonas sp. BLCC-B112 TaxID=3025319 RepID=UPI00234E0019|nr:N-6 DNA methylase [Pseudomonas sp. BLCC-B112]MDC7818763.1 N-6 DNA methylase [Pseudomonas sp. BLCC-B112]